MINLILLNTAHAQGLDPVSHVVPGSIFGFDIPVEFIAWTLAVFGLLKALSSFLIFVSEKTSNTWDNKVSDVVSKGLSLISKVIDFFTANTKPKG